MPPLRPSLDPNHTHSCITHTLHPPACKQTHTHLAKYSVGQIYASTAGVNMGLGMTGKLGCEWVWSSVHVCMGGGWVEGLLGLCRCMGFGRDLMYAVHVGCWHFVKY